MADCPAAKRPKPLTADGAETAPHATEGPHSPTASGQWDHSQRKFSFPKNKIRVLLLESISSAAADIFRKEGFAVESLTGALGETQLLEKIVDVHLVGVRSKTRLTHAVLSAAKRLKAVGCFCIGTDQTDLPAAEALGVPVFNSPFSNSRSVAELTLSHIISLSRKVPDHIRNMHNRVWTKTAEGCLEVRGKILGIVGYGHIGTQLGILAEAVGMKVFFYDTANVMPIGTATPLSSLGELLMASDVVSLHVPETEQTIGLIRATEIQRMHKGAILLNLSRGRVVDLVAVKAALESGHLAGFAADVFPEEPEKNGPLPEGFPMILAGCRNTILTPHVGGSTVEAQDAIGREVAHKLVNFLNTGNSDGAVNFPCIAPPPPKSGQHRILHVHRNVPGVLMAVNNVIAGIGNVSYQQLSTTSQIGYVVIDVEAKFGDELRVKLRELSTTIKVRILY
eukprot:RCo030243